MLNYSDYPASNEPRNLRISFGSLLVVAGLAYGLAVAVPQLQQSLTMKAEPQTLSWADLVRDGIGDNSHVHLHSVDLVVAEDQLSSIQNMISELDPQGDRAEMKQKLRESLAGVDTRQLLTEAASPAVVMPRGVDPVRVPAVVVISRFGTGLAQAKAEVAADASITAYVRKPWDLTWVEKLLNKFGDHGIKFELDKRPRYVLSPTLAVPDRNNSIGLVAACGMVATIGLVIAGSGGPSVLAFIFMPIPAIISLLGYPLRYGRGGRLARMFYLVVGVAGLIGGYHVAKNLGGLARVDGDTLLQSLGFILCVLGAAAIIGVLANARTSRRSVSKDENQRPYIEPEQGFHIAKVAASKTAIETEPNDQYTDPRLSDASEIQLSNSMQDQVETLCENGFGALKRIYVHDDSHRHLTALTLGCQKIVLCEIRENGKSSLTRFVSVLSDGLVIITLSASTPKISQLRIGKNGVYVRAKSDSQVDMLAEHLDRTVEIAEERRTQVVPMDEYERLDVFLLARRVLLDVQNEYKETNWSIPKATYGRFAFPGHSVEILVRQ